MPLLRKNKQEPVVEEPAPAHEEPTDRKRSLFSRRHRPTSPIRVEMNSRSASGDLDERNQRSRSRAGGIFSRHRSRSSDDYSDGDGVSARSGNGSGHNSSIHGRHLNDPSIISARQKVGGAEEAERQADRALVEARARVREAKQHVKNLEHDIQEEECMHKLKLQEAKQVSKSAKGLGRHG